METLSSPPRIGIAAAQSILSDRAVDRDCETRLAVALRCSADLPHPVLGSNRLAPPVAATASPDVDLERVAAEIVRSVESRLLGRVRDLRVGVVDGQFVLSGASNSYYVKQVAQHLAMNALDACMLGRLVNEIEVRSVR